LAPQSTAAGSWPAAPTGGAWDAAAGAGGLGQGGASSLNAMGGMDSFGGLQAMNPNAMAWGVQPGGYNQLPPPGMSQGNFMGGGSTGALDGDYATSGEELVDSLASLHLQQ